MFIEKEAPALGHGAVAVAHVVGERATCRKLEHKAEMRAREQHLVRVDNVEVALPELALNEDLVDHHVLQDAGDGALDDLDGFEVVRVVALAEVRLAGAACAEGLRRWTVALGLDRNCICWARGWKRRRYNRGQGCAVGQWR